MVFSRAAKSTSAAVAPHTKPAHRAQTAKEANPSLSETTTVLLKNISTATTESSLREAIDAVDTLKYRKVEMEPGCSIHFSNEADAMYANSLISSKYGYNGKISETALPALLLQNLPRNVSIDKLQSSFAKLKPKTIRVTGTSSIQAIFTSAEKALRGSKIIEELIPTEKLLKFNFVKLPDHSFAVQLHNFQNPASILDIEKSVKSALSSAFPDDDVIVSNTIGAPQFVSIRYSSHHQDKMDGIVAGLNKLVINGQKVIASNPREIRKPTLFIRNVVKVGEEKIQKVLSNLSCERLRINYKSKDSLSDLGVAFFATEEAAFLALSKLKSTLIDGEKIAASYREVAEPAITIHNLPSHFDEEKVLELFALYKPVRVEILESVSGVSALVVLGGLNDVDLAAGAFNRRVIDGKQVAISATPVNDICIDISMLQEGENQSSQMPITADDLTLAMKESGITAPIGISVNTNISAFVSFMTQKEVVDAQNGFLEGSVGNNIDSNNTDSRGLVTSRISVSPSYVLELSGVDPETPMSQMKDFIAGVRDDASEEIDNEVLKLKALKFDRSAIVKFKRVKEIVYGMRMLKTAEVDGQKLKVIRYRRVVMNSDNEIDEDGDDEDFDQFALKRALKDYMYADPATRYQLVKNYFERALTDAKALNNVEALMDKSASPAMLAEATQLLQDTKHEMNMSESDVVATDRLFELYIQREDLASFVHDFRATEAFFGPGNENDPFDWTQFKIEEWDDIIKLQEKMKASDESFMANPEEGAGMKGKKGKKNIVVKGEDDEEDETVSLEDINELTDSDGRLWSGAILDTDQVQKTMPGNRMMSHRALVVVGNLRGVAGFGMGKSKTTGDAVNAAFRDALRNLTFIDLYDKSGFAHDLHGKHNSCHAYIKATRRSRMMVASPFATAILNRFGVGSASCKLIGRRDPYAMVRAIFNAVAKHENIDEYAKDRGKRYLTLKWMHDNNV
jgi:small subunit ribosomal protein S5